MEAEDVRLQSASAPSRIDPQELREHLAERIKGQDHALDRLVSRLAVTRAELDQRPERPDGVFLFAGPTGVGKTALARALAEQLYGSPDAMIRLDMSEYAADWAITRLVGPSPGYVGSTDPESWLTTKIRSAPDSIVLLDEIEKAHPVVWNLFLQVFDAGRLTDGRGNEASFSKAVIIMTSNLGSEVFSSTKKALGFTASSPSPDAVDHEVIEHIRERMAPELVNRFDNIVVFRPLSQSTIRSVADQEMRGVIDRSRNHGYDLDIDPTVIDFIASHRYDQRNGARHLQRNIEELLLESIAVMPTGSYRAHLDGNRVAWVER